MCNTMLYDSYTCIHLHNNLVQNELGNWLHKFQKGIRRMNDEQAYFMQRLLGMQGNDNTVHT